MTWDEIFKNADGCSYNQAALKIKDQARYEVELLIGHEVDNEYEIEEYIKKHEIIFDACGHIRVCV